MLDTRVAYRRRHSYNTASNRTRLVKTPGGRLSLQYVKKVVKGVRAPGYLGGGRLAGLPKVRAVDSKNMSKTAKTVNRAYGGALPHDVVRERILRAFLIEEQKIVKMVLKKQADKQASESKKSSKKSKK